MLQCFNVIYLFFLPIIFFEMSLSWYSEYVGSGAGLMFDILLQRFSVSIRSVSFSYLGEGCFMHFSDVLFNIIQIVRLEHDSSRKKYIESKTCLTLIYMGSVPKCGICASLIFLHLELVFEGRDRLDVACPCSHWCAYMHTYKYI